MRNGHDLDVTLAELGAQRAVLGRVVVEEGHRFQPEMGIFLQRSHEKAAGLARAEHDHRVTPPRSRGHHLPHGGTHQWNGDERHDPLHRERLEGQQKGGPVRTRRDERDADEDECDDLRGAPQLFRRG